jgi:hypothetical protein
VVVAKHLLPSRWYDTVASNSAWVLFLARPFHSPSGKRARVSQRLRSLVWQKGGSPLADSRRQMCTVIVWTRTKFSPISNSISESQLERREQIPLAS